LTQQVASGSFPANEWGLEMSRELLATARTAAAAGVEVLQVNMDSVSLEDADTKGHHDFVTHVDRASEKAIIEVIRNSFPDHNILAEESGYQLGSNSGVRWIIDPLDGTTNFILGYPMFCVSVAAEENGEIVAGVVVDAIRNEEFFASKGQGAWSGEKRLHVSSTKELHGALLLTGFPFKAQQYLEDFITVFRQLLPKTTGIRRCGSAALDCAHLAAGRADGFWEFGLSAWDIAAGVLLIQEAGGIVSDVDGGSDYLNNGHLLAGNPEIYSLLRDEISSAFPQGFIRD